MSEGFRRANSPIEKKKRYWYTVEQKREMDSIFTRNPYPDQDVIDSLIAKWPDLTPKQIRICFQNKRSQMKLTSQSSDDFPSQQQQQQQQPKTSPIETIREFIPTKPIISSSLVLHHLTDTLPQFEKPPMLSPEIQFTEALLSSDYETIERLLQDGFDVNRRLRDLDIFAILFASIKGDQIMVQMLLKYGAQINVKNRESYTALHLAVMFGHTQITSILAQRRTNLNEVDIFGRTPVHIAVERQNIGILHILIQNQCDINIEDHCGLTPLHAAVSAFLSEICMILVVSGAAPDRSINNHESPLELAKRLSLTDSRAANIARIFQVFSDVSKVIQPAMRVEDSPRSSFRSCSHPNLDYFTPTVVSDVAIKHPRSRSMAELRGSLDHFEPFYLSEDDDDLRL